MTPANIQLLIRKQKLEKAVWEKTVQPYYWFGGVLPVGTEYKSFETRDFGYVVLKEEYNGHKFYRW